MTAFMSEAESYHITTPEEWISIMEELVKQDDTSTILIEFQLIPFDKLKSAPDYFVFDYFAYLVKYYDYSACEIAVESGATKREVCDLMKRVNFSPKNIARLSPEEDPLVLFSGEDKKKIRDYIHHSPYRKTINLETIRKLFARWQYPRYVSFETQVEYRIMFGKEETFLDFIEGSPWSNPNPEELAEATTSRIASLKPHRITYVNFLSFADFLLLSREFKELYIIFLIRLGAYNRKKLANILGIWESRAERIVDELDLFDEEINELSVARAQRDFEDHELKDYIGEEPITISIRKAVAIAEASQSRIGIKGTIENAVKEMIHGLVLQSQVAAGTTRKNTIRKEPEEMAQSAKKVYATLESIIGKKPGEMQLCDMDKAIKGCPVEPIHDYKTVFIDTEYLRAVMTYFGTSINSRLIVQYLFNDQSNRLRTRLSKIIKGFNLGKIAGPTSKENIYVRAAFVGWATKDYDAVNNYIEGERATFAKKASNMVGAAHKKKNNVTSSGKIIATHTSTIDTPSTATAPKCEAESESREASNSHDVAKRKTATIVLDATMPEFGKAMAALYSEYAGVIISVHQE